MEKLLFINSCVREDSRTKELAECLLGTLDMDAETVELVGESILPLDTERLAKRDMLLKSGQTDNEMFTLARQFASADTIVIAAPYWDLMFPSILKVYLENITVCGITFRYSEKGIPQSLCKAKKLYYVTTAGGFIGNNNFGFDYVKAVAAAFFGITDISFISAEGLDIIGSDTASVMKSAKEKILSGK